MNVFDPHVSKQDVKKKYNITIHDLKNTKEKFDCLIISVSHKEFVKSLHNYNSFFKNEKNKLIIDVKSIFKTKDLISQKFKYFQL